MKVALMARAVITNAVLLGIIWAVVQDDANRATYFKSLGFTISTAYYPLFYITSAVQGSTHIPGLLTLDWLQVLLVALAILDLGLVLPFLRRRRSPIPPSPPIPAPAPVS